MNNRIAINMIKSYSCSTQTPNNIYLGSIIIPKIEGVCDGDHINLVHTWPWNTGDRKVERESYSRYDQHRDVHH